jgi:hypothetical protein
MENSSASEMFKDAMIYHQSKLLMQPIKYEPKIAHVRFSVSSEFNKFIKAYNLKEYPTLILLDSKANPIRTVIGFSWFEAPNLYMTQKRLIEGKGIQGLKIVKLLIFSIVPDVRLRVRAKCIGRKSKKERYASTVSDRQLP